MALPSPARRWAPWLLVLPLLALGCNRQSPTEPASSSPKIASVSSDTTGNAATGGTVIDKSHGGNGGGNGQGHGGNGGGGNGNGGGNGHGHGGGPSLQNDPPPRDTQRGQAPGHPPALPRGSGAGESEP